MKSFFRAAAVFAGIVPSFAYSAVIYDFSFPNTSAGSFKLEWVTSDYITTTGLQSLSSPQHTPFGYSVNYIGTSNDGSFLFSNDKTANIYNGGINFSDKSFAIMRFDNYITSPGTYGGIVAHDSFFSNATITVSKTSDAPEPATWAMMVSGFGLVGAARRYRKSGIKRVYFQA